MNPVVEVETLTTIGTAVLQIIPSLRGVTEEIEKQIDGQVIDVKVAPKVDQKAADTVGKQTRETVEKHTSDIKVAPKVDTRTAEKTGKTTGEAVAKGAKEAVRKGDIGKTVSDEVTKTVEKTTPGKEIAKVIVDGLADGVKQGMPRGGIGQIIVDGLADGVKQGIDRGGVGKTIVNQIGTGIKSGNLAKTIKDAVLPGISQIGTELQSGAAHWARGIGDALRSGDIEGATDDIGSTVRATTDVIATIGSTFGLQLDGVRKFGTDTASTLQSVGSNVQDIIGRAATMKSTFADTGELLGAVLPGRAGSGAKSIIDSLGTIIPIANGVYEALDKITQEWHAGQQERYWARWEADNRARDLGVKPPQPGVGDFGGPPRVGQGDAPAAPAKPRIGSEIRSKIATGQMPGFSVAPNGDIIGPDGKPIPGLGVGGFTGSFPVDKIAGFVHGKEFVFQATSQQRIENDHPGLLNYMNKTGKLPIPGYQGGGLVAGTSELRKIISEKFGIANIGGWRPQDKYGEHSTGRALDVMTSDKSTGDAIKDFALANASAIDLKWVIWRKHLFYPGGGGYDMPDRGNPTQNHMDHVHIFSGTGIINGLRGTLKGLRGSNMTQALTQAGPGAIDPTSTDTTGAATPVATSSDSPAGVSVPSSLSGLSTWGLDNLGVTTKATPNSPDRTFDIGKAAGSAVSGQVSSALNTLGVGDSPGWLQGISKFVGGLSISDPNGKKIFGGGSIGTAFGDARSGDRYGGAAPIATSARVGAAPVPDAAHGTQAGQRPGPTFNTTFNTGDTEQAFTQWKRWQDERAAAKLDRF